MDLINGRRVVLVDLRFLMELLKLASAGYAWRTAKSLAECENAQGVVWSIVTRLTQLHKDPTPMIHGMSAEEVQALLEAAQAAGNGMVN